MTAAKTPSGNVVKLHPDITAQQGRQECVKTGPCPCEAPCRWALQALDDVRRVEWPTHALRLVDTLPAVERFYRGVMVHKPDPPEAA